MNSLFTTFLWSLQAKATGRYSLFWILEADACFFIDATAAFQNYVFSRFTPNRQNPKVVSVRRDLKLELTRNGRRSILTAVNSRLHDDRTALKKEYNKLDLQNT